MEARDADELSIVHRTVPTTTCFQVLNVSSAKVEKPEVEGEQECLLALRSLGLGWWKGMLREVDRSERFRRQNHLVFMFHYVPDTPLTSWDTRVSKIDKFICSASC